MIDAKKREEAVNVVWGLCLQCKPEEHSDECPVAKAAAAVLAIPAN